MNSILALVIASWSKILMLLSSEAVRAFMFSSIVAISAPVPFLEDVEGKRFSGQLVARFGIA